MVLAGEIALPAGEVGEPFVDVDDIAALTEDGHAGQVYELTGFQRACRTDPASGISGP